MIFHFCVALILKWVSKNICRAVQFEISHGFDLIIYGPNQFDSSFGLA
jgi:hypothetical protein